MFTGEEFLAYWHDLSWPIALCVFFLYIVLDILFVHYTLSVGRLNAVRAANTGAIMYLILAVGIVNYVHNPLYIAAVFLGSWIGTFLSVKLEARKQRKKEP